MKFTNLKYLILIIIVLLLFPKSIFALENTSITFTDYGKVIDGSYTNYGSNFQYITAGFDGSTLISTSKMERASSVVMNANSQLEGYYDLQFLLWKEGLIYGQNLATNLTNQQVSLTCVSGSQNVCYQYDLSGTPLSNKNQSSNFLVLVNGKMCSSSEIVYNATMVTCSNVYINHSINFNLSGNMYTQDGSTLNAQMGISGFKSAKSNYQINSEILDENKKQTEESKKTNDLLENDNTDEANDKGSEFFDEFEYEFNNGVSDIIVAPLVAIGNITSGVCVPLSLNVPFVEENINLPCMYEIYSSKFGNFLTLYQLVTFGLIAYWVIVKIFSTIKDMVDPDNDKVEVLDL